MKLEKDKITILPSKPTPLPTPPPPPPLPLPNPIQVSQTPVQTPSKPNPGVKPDHNSPKYESTAQGLPPVQVDTSVYHLHVGDLGEVTLN